MKLQEIKRVDEDKPACRPVGDGVWDIQPGDATRYQVAVGPVLAVCVTGCIDDDNRHGVMVHAESGHFNVIGKPTTYTLEVCRYFAACAANPDGFWARREPEGLASRRG